jgi:hypothetical protein
MKKISRLTFRLYWMFALAMEVRVLRGAGPKRLHISLSRLISFILRRVAEVTSSGRDF